MTTRKGNIMGKHLKYPTRCRSCGAQLKYSQAHALRYCKPLRYAHAGNHMCRACYMKCYRDCADPDTFEHKPTRRANPKPRLSFPTPCKVCGIELRYSKSYASKNHKPSKNAHAGYGMCGRCIKGGRGAKLDSSKPCRYPFPCSSCGAPLKYPLSQASAQKRPYRYAHAGHGLCQACFAACKRAGADPATFKHKPKRLVRHKFPCPCVKCGREMTYPHDGKFPGRGIAHSGRGLCVICYNEEKNEKRKAARRAAKNQGKSDA